LAARIVTGSLVNSGYFTIRKGGGVKARSLVRVLVKPEADRILRLHVRVLLGLDQGERDPALLNHIAVGSTSRSEPMAGQFPTCLYFVMEDEIKANMVRSSSCSCKRVRG